MMAKIVRQVEAEPDYHVQLEVNRPQPDATVSDAISCAIRRVSRTLPVAVLVNYTESGNSTLRAARERPKAPILSLTPNLRTARRLTVAWACIRWSTSNWRTSTRSARPPSTSPWPSAWRAAATPWWSPPACRSVAPARPTCCASRPWRRRWEISEATSSVRLAPSPRACGSGHPCLSRMDGAGIRGRVSIHPGKTFLSDHGLPRALPCRPWTFKASGSTPAGGLFSSWNALHA